MGSWNVHSIHKWITPTEKMYSGFALCMFIQEKIHIESELRWRFYSDRNTSRCKKNLPLCFSGTIFTAWSWILLWGMRCSTVRWGRWPWGSGILLFTKDILMTLSTCMYVCVCVLKSYRKEYGSRTRTTSGYARWRANMRWVDFQHLFLLGFFLCFPKRRRPWPCQ